MAIQQSFGHSHLHLHSVYLLIKPLRQVQKLQDNMLK